MCYINYQKQRNLYLKLADDERPSLRRELEASSYVPKKSHLITYLIVVNT
jgi:hypothetical protein